MAKGKAKARVMKPLKPTLAWIAVEPSGEPCVACIMALNDQRKKHTTQLRPWRIARVEIREVKRKRARKGK